MGALHHDDVRRPGLGHDLGLEPAAVHRLQVSHDRRLRKSLAQRAHAVHALGDDERRPGLQPVHSATDGELGGLKRLWNVDEIE